MFSRDVSHYSRTPRTLQSSKFGPYARISIPQRRSKIVDALYVVLYGAAVGAVWYGVVLLRVGS
jgi:VanZ family protein